MKITLSLQHAKQDSFTPGLSFLSLGQIVSSGERNSFFFLTEKNTFENTPLFDGIFRYLLIQKGTAQITITGLEYFLKPSCLVVLAPEYYCQFTEIGSDFQGSLLLVDKSYLDTLPASDKMYRHITKVMLQQRQVNLLNQQQHRVVSESIHTIQEKLKLTHHHLKHEIIQNALVTFLPEPSAHRTL